MDKFLGMFKTKAPITILGVIVIGVIGSAIYDALVKPSFGVVSNFLFGVFTLGSQQMKDAAYSSAALDPSGLPSLMVLMFLIVGMAFYVVSTSVASELRRRRFDQNFEGPKMPKESLRSPREDLSDKNIKTRKIRILLYLSRISAACFLVSAYIMISTLNQSILVWRVHTANLNIIAPYVQVDKILKLKSAFSAVRTEKEFVELYGVMKQIASQNNVQLRQDVVW